MRQVAQADINCLFQPIVNKVGMIRIIVQRYIRSTGRKMGRLGKVAIAAWRGEES